MAVWENELLVFGGWDGQEELGDLHIFNTGTATWRKVTTSGATPRARHFHNCICVDNRLYVFGGYDGENWRNDVRVLDLRTNTWQPEATMHTAPGARASGSACAIDANRILVFGGYDGNDFLDDMWILDTEDPNTGEFSLKWTEVKKPPPGVARGSQIWPSARSGHSVEVVDKFIVMFGGRHRHGRFNDVCIFDTSKLQWTDVQIAGSSPRQRKTHAMTRIANRFFMFGGHDGAEWLSDFHVLELGPVLGSLREKPTIEYPPSTVMQDLARLLPFPGDSVRSMLDSVGYFSRRRERLVWSESRAGTAAEPAGSGESQLSQGGGSPSRCPALGRSVHRRRMGEKARDVVRPRPAAATMPLVLADGPRPPVSDVATAVTAAAAAGAGRRTPLDGDALDEADDGKDDGSAVGGLGEQRRAGGSISGAGAGGGDIDVDQEERAPPLKRLPSSASSAGRSFAPVASYRGSRSPSSATEAHWTRKGPEAGDTTFVVEGYRVALHRCILAARSEYFRVMFSCGMSESVGREIPLEDTSLPGFLAVVRYLYTDQLPPEDELEEYLPLLVEEAHKLGLESLSKRCQRLLEERMDVHNVSSMLQLADNVQAFPLRAACHKFMVRNLSSVRLEPSFLQLPAELLREVLYRSARRRWTAEQRQAWPLSKLEPSAAPSDDGSGPNGGEQRALTDAEPRLPELEVVERGRCESQSTTTARRRSHPSGSSALRWRMTSAEDDQRGSCRAQNDTQEALAGASPTEGADRSVLPVSPPRGPLTPNASTRPAASASGDVLPARTASQGGLTFSSRAMDHCGGSDGGEMPTGFRHSRPVAAAASDHSPVEAHGDAADEWGTAPLRQSSMQPRNRRGVSSGETTRGDGRRSRKRRREDRDTSGGEEEGTLESSCGSAASGDEDVHGVRRKRQRLVFTGRNGRRGPPESTEETPDEESAVSAVVAPDSSGANSRVSQRAGSESPVAKTPNVTN